MKSLKPLRYSFIISYGMQAAAACESRGLTGSFLDACIFDAVATEDVKTFVETSAETQSEDEVLEIEVEAENTQFIASECLTCVRWYTHQHNGLLRMQAIAGYAEEVALSKEDSLDNQAHGIKDLNALFL